MTDRGVGILPDAAGGPARHVPVLLEAVLQGLKPAAHEIYCDGTFGAGGYTRAILQTPETRVIAIDRDPDAIAAGAGLVAESAGRLQLVQNRFGNLAGVMQDIGIAALDGVVLDIGVSSMQFDEAQRGFSFRFDAPLDMRMEQKGRSAADIVNEADEAELADILYYYGEERRARAMARLIAAERKKAPVQTTRQLSDLITRIEPVRPNKIHPATRSFQALRIAVNDELGELVRALAGAEAILNRGGRLAVVTFHSLEDRIVKQFLASRSGRGEAISRRLPGEPVPDAPTFALLTRKAIEPSQDECARNPRARSAKLRVAIRTDAPALGIDDSIAALAALPSHSGGRRR